MRIVGLILVVLVLLVGIGTNLGAMGDAPSFLIAFLFTLGALLLGGAPLPLMIRGIRPASLAPAEAAQAATGWRLARISSLAAGGLGSGVGWVIMLRNLDDPAAMGPGAALCLLTVLYGLFVAFVIALPVQAALQPAAFDEDASITPSAVLGVLLSTLLAVSTCAILYVAFTGQGG